MRWFEKYIETYGLDWERIPEAKFDNLRNKISTTSNSTPVASVVLIAHNEGKHLFPCLESIFDNTASFPYEVFVVNNNSTDSTEELLKTLGIKYFNETKKGPGHARQNGLDHANGKFYLCIDSDTLYPPHYIETMVSELKKPRTSCVYGLWSFMPDENHSAPGLFIYEIIRDIYLMLQQFKRPELNVRGMAFAFPTELGRKYGFRTDIIRGEDGSLALKMKEDGKLRLLTSRKVRPVTGHGTTSASGGLSGMFLSRAKKAITTLSHLFTAKNHYDDEESNLIK